MRSACLSFAFLNPQYFLRSFRSNFELVSTFRGHRSPVIFLDWSEDGAYIQSCDERGGFMYWDSMSGVQVDFFLAFISFLKCHDHPPSYSR
jgi:WD40 repeat protein